MSGGKGRPISNRNTNIKEDVFIKVERENLKQPQQ
jgi:hypothetical protein